MLVKLYQIDLTTYQWAVALNLKIMCTYKISQYNYSRYFPPASPCFFLWNVMKNISQRDNFCNSKSMPAPTHLPFMHL